jgi:hypothetical protein
LTWESVAGFSYFVTRCTNYVARPMFCVLANNILGQAGTTTYTDTDPPWPGPAFYRIGVDLGTSPTPAPFSCISFAWLQQFNLPTDSSADYVDTDHDGLNNWKEWCAHTDPTNALSVLTMLTPTNSASGWILSWQSVSGVTYYLQRGVCVDGQPVFSCIQSNLAGQAGVMSCADTNCAGAGPFFYRVGVQ